MTPTNAAVEVLRWAAGGHDAAGRDPAFEDPRTLVLLQRTGIDSLLYLSTGAPSPVQQAYDTIWRCQREALVELLTALTAAGVQTLVLKGAELIPARFGGRALGIMADIDILVRREQIGTARQVLFKHDYRQAIYDPQTHALVDRDIAHIAEIEARHYELAPFCRVVPMTLSAEGRTIVQRRDRDPAYATGDAVNLVVAIDLHHGIATDVDPAPLFTRATPSVHGVASTLSAADHLWFVVSRMYNEIAVHDNCTLRGFAYTLPLLRRGDLDWAVVSQVAADLALGPTLYYHLYFMHWLCGGVPAELLEQLHPRRNSRARDWGWQLAKLFDTVDPFPLALESHAT